MYGRYHFIMKKYLALFLLISVIGCSKDDNHSEPEPTTTVMVTTTVQESEPTTTIQATTTTMPATTTTTVAPPCYGFKIADGGLVGCYNNLTELVNRANELGVQSCIFANGCKIKSGFGPCMSLSISYDVTKDPICIAAPTTTTVPAATTTTIVQATTTTVPPVYNPPPVGGDMCASYSQVERMDVPISFNRTILSNFGPGTAVVARFQVPASGTGYIDATVAEWTGPPTFRHATISSYPCDFRKKDLTGANGPIGDSSGTTPQIMINIGGNNPKLIPGQTYYLNVRNSWVDENGTIHEACSTNCVASIVVVERNPRMQ